MQILVLGGTRFVGVHVVEALLAAGHEVTLLNRGLTNPGRFADLPLIRLDRATDSLAPVAARDWDGVIDLQGLFPSQVSRLLASLSGRCGRYVLVSSVSAYAAMNQPARSAFLRETDALEPWLPEHAAAEIDAPYGARKAECERVALAQAAVPVVVLRPSLVYGAGDPTDRMAYWFWRAAQPVPLVLPDDGLVVIQRTYAPDFAQMCLAALTAPNVTGHVYNTAEPEPLSLRDTLQALGAHLGTDPLARAVSVSADVLAAQCVEPWTDMPCWLPRAHRLIDTFKQQRDLPIEATPVRQALATAADAFLALGWAPVAGWSRDRELAVLASRDGRRGDP